MRACALPRLAATDTHIVDATAGLGSDAFMLASRGCQVTAVERNPVVFALLRDGVERAQRADGVVADIARRITVVHADSRAYLLALRDAPAERRPHIISLDPMYPSPPGNARKQALPKKGMQYLRQVVGSDPDDVGSMLEAALECALRRAVLKRPSHAPLELELQSSCVRVRPTHSYAGTRHRFDAFAPVAPPTAATL